MIAQESSPSTDLEGQTEGLSQRQNNATPSCNKTTPCKAPAAALQSTREKMGWVACMPVFNGSRKPREAALENELHCKGKIDTYFPRDAAAQTSHSHSTIRKPKKLHAPDIPVLRRCSSAPGDSPYCGGDTSGLLPAHRHRVTVVAENSTDPNGCIEIECLAPDGEKHKDILETIRGAVIGKDSVLWTPFGRRRLVYCDYTASGRLLGKHLDLMD